MSWSQLLRNAETAPQKKKRKKKNQSSFAAEEHEHYFMSTKTLGAKMLTYTTVVVDLWPHSDTGSVGCSQSKGKNKNQAH